MSAAIDASDSTSSGAERPAPLATIPSRLGPWRQVGEDILPRHPGQVLDLRHLQRTYTLEDVETAATLSLHRLLPDLAAERRTPERCWSVHGGVGFDAGSIVSTFRLDATALIHCAERPIAWSTGDRSRRLEEHPLPVGPIGLRSTMFGIGGWLRQLGGYFFVANGRTTDNWRWRTSPSI